LGLRDKGYWTGAVVQAGAGGAEHFLDAFHAQVLACAAALNAASERGMMRVELETDSLMLRNAIQEN
jgi:ribonuclease HI